MKKIKIALFIITVLFAVPSVHSQIMIHFGLGKQSSDGIIFKKDKQQLKGLVNFPDYGSKKIKIKVEDKYEKLLSIDIDSIQIFNENKKLVYTFVRTKTKIYKSKGTKFKVIDEKWICLIKKGKLSLYIAGEDYGIKKDTMKVVKGDSNYYLKQKKDDYPILISIDPMKASIGYNVFFKEYGQYYFSNNTDIAEKIKNKEYKYKDIEKLVDYYNGKNSKNTIKSNKNSKINTSNNKKKAK